MEMVVVGGNCFYQCSLFSKQMRFSFHMLSLNDTYYVLMTTLICSVRYQRRVRLIEQTNVKCTDSVRQWEMQYMELELSLKKMKREKLYIDEYCDELQKSLKEMTKKKSDVETELWSLKYRPT